MGKVFILFMIVKDFFNKFCQAIILSGYFLIRWVTFNGLFCREPFYAPKYSTFIRHFIVNIFSKNEKSNSVYLKGRNMMKQVFYVSL